MFRSVAFDKSEDDKPTNHDKSEDSKDQNEPNDRETPAEHENPGKGDKIIDQDKTAGHDKSEDSKIQNELTDREIEDHDKDHNKIKDQEKPENHDKIKDQDKPADKSKDNDNQTGVQSLKTTGTLEHNDGRSDRQGQQRRRVSFPSLQMISTDTSSDIDESLHHRTDEPTLTTRQILINYILHKKQQHTALRNHLRIVSEGM